MQPAREYIDASKLADFQRCPRAYEYRHVSGYRPAGDAVDLDFGQLLGSALETFEKELLSGTSHDAAHKKALAGILEGATRPDGTNRFGRFVGTWRCTGSTPYKNDKGNTAKCPYSHKGKYFQLPAPPTCSCGSEIVHVELWVPTKASKDIDKLVELFVGYSDAAHSRALLPTSLDGKPLIEYFWEEPFYQPFMARPVILCGNLDAVKKFGDEAFIVDYKTTGKTLNAQYWTGFTPNVQVDLYNMAAQKILPTLNIQGVAIEAFSTVGESNLGFKLFRSTDSQKAEMYEDTGVWLSFLQQCQDSGIWPRNRTSCFLCPFQPVCSKPEEARQGILDEKFERGIWNPKTRSVEPIQMVGTDTPPISAQLIPFPSSPRSTEPTPPPTTEASSPSTTETSTEPPPKP